CGYSALLNFPQIMRLERAGSNRRNPCNRRFSRRIHRRITVHRSQVFLRLVSSRHCLAFLLFDIQSDVVPPMSEQGERPELRISVIGTFRVLAPNDEDLTPRGRKARALLALLALTPTRRRSRPALQDKLWSDRGPEQGAASLRQALTEIRRAFGE